MRYPEKFFWPVLLAAVLIRGIALRADDAGYRIIVKPDHKDALYQTNKKINFNISLVQNDTLVPGEQLTYSLYRDGYSTVNGVLTSKTEPVRITTSLDHSGFVLCTVRFKTAQGKGGAGVEPEKITAPPADTQTVYEFWDTKIKQLRALPLEVWKTPVPTAKRYHKKLECFDIRVNCPGSALVSGYFIKPVKAKARSLPAFVSFHGAGVYSAGMPYRTAVMGALSLDVNAHGIDNGKPADFYKKLQTGKFKGYPFFHSDDREKSYFCGMLRRVYRALQFIKAQPEWDGKTLIVYGSSQGGAQALFAAAADPDVSLAVVRVPALCNHYGIFDKRQPGWPHFIRLDKNGKPVNKAVAECAKYYDMALLTPRIKAEIIMTAGFIDTTCPPSSVYAAYNAVKSKKRIINNIASGHRCPPETTDTVFEVIYGKLKQKRNNP
ncbi:MAG: acetylxylan esterase [Victivallales bacterium]|nr:acetylxylan esterase [Victivallales bacterium]